MLRGVADVNVLVSAFVGPLPPTSPRLVIDAAFDGHWRLVVSPVLLAELDDVLRRDKFRRRVSLEEAEVYVAEVRRRADVVAGPPPPWAAVTRDPDDDYLVALARFANVDFLISGDVHLTELADLVPPVRTPAEFLAMLQAGR